MKNLGIFLLSLFYHLVLDKETPIFVFELIKTDNFLYKSHHDMEASINEKISNNNIDYINELLLGKKVKQRYPHLIDDYKKINSFIIYALDNLDSIFTLKLHIHGMFNNTNVHKVNKKDLNSSIPPMNLDSNIYEEELTALKDYSIPYFSQYLPFRFFVENDEFFLFDREREIKCPYISSFKNKQLKADTVKNIINNFIQKYKINLIKIDKKIENHFNIINDFEQIINTVDNFKNDYETKNLDENCGGCVKEAQDFLNYTLYNIKLNNDIYRTIISPLLRQLLHTIESKIMNETNENIPNYVLYSGDSQMTGSIIYMFNKLYDTPLYYPNISSLLFIELCKDDNQKYYIKYFRGDELLLKVDCNSFIKKVSEIIMPLYEIKRKCLNSNNSNVDNLLYFISFISIFIISIVIVKTNISEKKMAKSRKLNPLEDIM